MMTVFKELGKRFSQVFLPSPGTLGYSPKRRVNRIGLIFSD